MTTQNADSAALQQSQSPAAIKDNWVAVNDDELHKLLLPNINDLPVSPPSAMESNFVTYFAPGLF
ncbi:hypothetical protein HanHA300_Chr13g0464041 [Helianthus annuus]|nr:hypothetical protein HanHA300_Chr13g0464041 [Helianthus annuus]